MPMTDSRASRLDRALEDVRAALRVAAVDQVARTTVGGVIEIFADSLDAALEARAAARG